MNKKIFILVIFQAIVIVVLFWSLIFLGKDEYDQKNTLQEEEVTTQNRSFQTSATTIVKVSKVAQLQSGIQTQPLTLTSKRVTLNTLGNVLNVDALIEERARYLNATSNANLLNILMLNQARDYHRMHLLNQDDKNVSDQAMQLARTNYEQTQVKYKAALLEVESIANTIRTNWGVTIAKEVMQAKLSPLFDNLLSRNEVLILVTYPNESSITEPFEKVTLRPISTSNVIEASLICESTSTDPTIQGRTYYYHAPAKYLRSGMRLNVEIHPDKQEKQGVIIPQNAIIRYAGLAWVYKKQKEEEFVRIPVKTDTNEDNGWFNPLDLLHEGDEIVINGAQLLLSEEFKYQIKNENQD
jgi:membrane fusion protein, multidrug efflux system